MPIDREGVTKFNLDYKQNAFQKTPGFDHLNAWRSLLFRLKLIGQDPQRYDGYAFGNVSLAVSSTQTNISPHSSFIITGTQTGNLEHASEQDYALVIESFLHENRIIAEGPHKPSSEALTHASVYTQDHQVTCVMHVHCPEIWAHTRTLKIPAISSEICYGTPEMAKAVGELFRSNAFKDIKLFSMLGHQDGIVSFGYSTEEAGQTLVKYLARALSENPQLDPLECAFFRLSCAD